MIVCPTCSSPNPDGATTCSTCGSPLGGASSTNRYPMALPPGTKLNGGAFSVGRVLGQGGFGITYKGNDINLARLVAIKELFPDGSHRQGHEVVPPRNVSESEWKTTRDEFIEEARTVARFRHPGIVNVYFVWEENGTAYQAMEYLDGQSAGGMVEKGKLREAQALPIIERVAEALDVMHASGFIHRDLKPDNIVQTNDGRTVLIDFGTAKQFVREKTQKLNPVLTPGYAPLEQYSSQARFDHRLDIYALGATLYHLLTGEIPVSAVERAAGVDLPSVREKNPAVSQTVSDAVEKAMAIKVGDRFESARDFAKALRTPQQTPAPFPVPQQQQVPRPNQNQNQPIQPKAPSPTPQPSSFVPSRDALNPYLSQIRTLSENLKQASVQTPFPKQGRIDAIERELKPLAGWRAPSATNCPSCHQNSVKAVTGNFSGLCSFDNSPLSRIEWPVGKCAICRVGTLNYHTLPPSEFFCAVCKRAPVQRVGKPALLGLVSVPEFECPACEAQYQPVGTNAARLKQVGFLHGQTPLLGQTCTYAQWNDAAGASGQVADCSNCHARFIEQKNRNLLLAAWESDPYGVAQSIGHQGLPIDQWAKIAAGGGSEPTTHRCSTCHAHWSLDVPGQTLALVRANAPEQEQARKWGFVLGQNYPINRWNAKASGKASGEVGRICTNCRTEFDFRPQNTLEKFALVTSKNPLLSGRSALVLDWGDWHRITQRLMLSSEERALHDEESKLLSEREADRARQSEAAEHKRRDISAQLDGLFKRSALEGFAQMGVTARDARPGERLEWAGRAISFKYRSREQATYWDRDSLVRVVISDSRLWIEDSKSFLLSEVNGIEIQYQSRLPILVVHLGIYKRPLGFGVDPTEIDVTVDGETRRLLFDVHDVAAILKRLT